MDLAVSHTPDEAGRALELATLAEGSGIAYFGLADSPVLHAGVFPVMQHVLAGTKALRVGTFVTNPVLRHPAVLGADFDLLGRLYPGRVWAGIGAGDTSVRSVGLPAAKSAELGAAIATIGQRAGDRAPVFAAVGGLATARRLPPGTSGIIIGGGLEPSWLRSVIATAEAAAGHRLRRWGFAMSSVLAPGADAEVHERALDDVTGSVFTVSRHGLGSDPASRGVPPALVPGLAELFAGYDLSGHGQVGGTNTALVARFPEQRCYLLDRFALVGTATELAARLADLQSALGADDALDGVVLTSGLPDPDAHIRRIGRELVPLVRTL